jgi:hypothetical protein
MILAVALIPATGGASFVIFWFIGAISMIAWVFFSAALKRRRILSDAISIADAYDSESYDGEFFIDDTTDQYRFPKRCPNCDAELSLDKVTWVDSTTALCPNCESAVRAND